MKKFFKETFRFIGALLSLIRGVMILGMVTIAGIMIYFINEVAVVTVNQYNESLIWESTAYEAPLAEIEPALVSNVIDTDAVDAAAAWEELEDYVDNLDGQSMPDKDRAVEILNRAVHWQNVYHLKSDAITRLDLYIKLEDAISEAYETLDTTKLQELGGLLYSMEMEEKTDTGQQYMERLRGVSGDFKEVKTLMTETIWSVGTIKDGVWTIPYTYTRTDLAEVLKKIKTMEKFPAVKDTAAVLSDIADVLNYNKNAREYSDYKQFKEAVERASRLEYVPVSSIYTYSQALAFGCSIEVDSIDGYTVSMDSPVEALYYQGNPLNPSQYVKRGTPLTAVINEVYELSIQPQPEQSILPQQAPVQTEPYGGFIGPEPEFETLEMEEESNESYEE